MKTQNIGKEKAIELFESKWWENRTHQEIAKFQLLTAELCCPFGVFHEALEKSLDRPVYTHELGMNYEGLVQELFGERDAPTLEEIMEMIPEGKRIVLQL
jgi:hypothetical protein